MVYNGFQRLGMNRGGRYARLAGLSGALRAGRRQIKAPNKNRKNWSVESALEELLLCPPVPGSGGSSGPIRIRYRPSLVLALKSKPSSSDALARMLLYSGDGSRSSNRLVSPVAVIHQSFQPVASLNAVKIVSVPNATKLLPLRRGWPDGLNTGSAPS